MIDTIGFARSSSTPRPGEFSVFLFLRASKPSTPLFAPTSTETSTSSAVIISCAARSSSQVSRFRALATRELRSIYEVDTLEPQAAPITFDIAVTFVRKCSGGPLHVLGRTKWMYHSYQDALALTGMSAVGGIYFARALIRKRNAAENRKTSTSAVAL